MRPAICALSASVKAWPTRPMPTGSAVPRANTTSMSGHGYGGRGRGDPDDGGGGGSEGGKDGGPLGPATWQSHAAIFPHRWTRG